MSIAFVLSRVVPDSGSGFGWNSAFCSNPAEIQFGRISGFQPDLQNATLTGKKLFVYLSFHAITSRYLRDLARQCVHGATRFMT